MCYNYDINKQKGRGFIEENGIELFTFTELSIKLGKHPKYFTQIKYRHPELFERVKIKKVGTLKFMSVEVAKSIILELHQRKRRRRKDEKKL